MSHESVNRLRGDTTQSGSNHRGKELKHFCFCELNWGNELNLGLGEVMDRALGKVILKKCNCHLEGDLRASTLDDWNQFNLELVCTEIKKG